MNFEQQQIWNRLRNEPGNYYERAAEPEREDFRRLVKDVLQDGKVLVEFVKSDGTVRTMNCTLNEAAGAKYVVKENKETSAKTKKPNNDVQVVWDCDQEAWRSFRWDRLKRIEFSIG